LDSGIIVFPSLGESSGQQRVGQHLSASPQARSDADSFDSVGIEQAQDRDPSSSVQSHPTLGCFPTRLSQGIARVRGRWKNLPRMGFFPALQDSVLRSIQPSGDQVLTIQAARWLLATTSNRGDQISTAQFICSLDKPICVNVFEDHDSWKHLLNLTLGGFEIWHSQPDKENQEASDLFGLLLCRVLLQCSREDDRWKDLTRVLLSPSHGLGTAFLQTLILASCENSSGNPKEDRHIFDISIHFALLKARIALEQFQWMTDHASTTQFICSLDRATLSYMFEDHDCWKGLVSLTLSAFENWYSQPNKENQKVAELFGLALCRVILQCPKEDKKWEDISEISLPGSKGFGEMFLQTLVPASSKYSSAEPDDDQRILHLSVMFTAYKKKIDLKEFQWAKLSHLLDSRGPAAGALLQAWAVLVFAVGAATQGGSLRGYLIFTELLESR
ncbi:hypothetical protein FRC01_002025, partial [Tulasnella sp. 417]